MTDTPIPRASGNALPLSQLLGHGADAVAAVLAGHSLTDALTRVPGPARPGAQALSFHAMRWLGGAQAARRTLAPRRPPPAVDSLLLLALTLLWPEAPALYAPHTLVDQAVACARKRAPNSASFVNAVLRRFLRDAAQLVPALQVHDVEARWQHPRWWIDRLRGDWPTQWEALLRADQSHPPMMLRVNARQASAEAYAARLAEHGIDATVIGPQALRLSQPTAVQALPGFADGWVSVQDAHAQMAAPLLVGTGVDALRPGARVLDACAAPGGKTAHLLELAAPDANWDLLALDIDEARLVKVRDTLARQGLQARTLAADARTPSAWWDGQPFDAILLDAPCSASGVARRHPDVRWLRRDSDIAALARIQAELLDALWPLLAPGGRLVYATCSLFRAEGEHQIEAFSQRQPGARRQPAPGHLHPLADNAQVVGAALPLGGDGFYYARLDKSQ